MSRTKSSSPEKYVPSIREIRVSLFSEYQWIGLLSGRDKPYDHIIKDLIKIGEYWNSDEYDREDGAFTMKWFSDRLNETPAHISKWLRTIYDDLFELNCQEPELFAEKDEILCEFYISGYRDGMACCFNFGLPALPHVGDTLVFPFVKATLDCNYFFIKEISYHRNMGKTRIAIHCEAGVRYNKFREFLLDKARFMDEIGIMTEYEARPYLDEMLQAYERRGHVPSVETIKREREERWKRWEESRKKT